MTQFVTKYLDIFYRVSDKISRHILSSLPKITTILPSLPKITTMSPTKKSKTSQITLAGEEELFKPNFRVTIRQAEKEKPATIKETKRAGKVNRDVITKGQKECTEIIEDKIENLGAEITDSLRTDLKEGFTDITKDLTKVAKQIEQLVNIMVQNNTKPIPQTDTIVTIQPEGIKPQEDKQEKMQMDYQNIMQRYNTLPAGQEHLQKEWKEDAQFHQDGQPEKTERRQTEHKVMTTEEINKLFTTVNKKIEKNRTRKQTETETNGDRNKRIERHNQGNK